MDSKWTTPTLHVPRGFDLADDHLVLRPEREGSGSLPETIPPSDWRMAEVIKAADGSIHWALFHPTARRRALARILDEFVKIESADGVLAFACGYGFLRPMRPDRREPVARWFEVVQLARAIRNCAAHLRMDREPVREDAFLVWPACPFRGKWRDRLRLEMGLRISQLIELSSIRPFVWFDAESAAWRMTFCHPQQSAGSTSPWIGNTHICCLGLIALRLMAEVTGARQPVLCAHCGEPFVPARVQAGRGSYCNESECKRAISARSKAKRRAEIRLQDRS